MDETLPTEDKIKRATDAKVSSKVRQFYLSFWKEIKFGFQCLVLVFLFQAASEFSPELAKVSSDIKNLRMEESNLRQENVELKVMSSLAIFLTTIE